MKENIDYVKCPICGKEYKLLSTHLKAHNLTVTEFKIKYPKQLLISEKEKKLRSDKFKIKNKDKSFRAKNLKGIRSSSKHKEAAGNTLRKLNKNMPIEMRNKQIESVIRSNKSKARRELARDNGLRRFKEDPEKFLNNMNSGGISKRETYVFKNGEAKKLRSNLETRIITELDKRQIIFTYETLRIPYIFKDIERTYIPDIYIEPNIIIEIKPKNLRESKQVQAKREAAEKAGYRYYYVGALWELDKIPL